jgi:1-pyrroline-5-carboxylate dehydrogenase
LSLLGRPMTTTVDSAPNSAVRIYPPGSPERTALARELAIRAGEPIDARLYIDGSWRSGSPQPLTAPHDHTLRVASVHIAAEPDVNDAIDAALRAHATWSRTTLEERSAIFARAATLLEHERRDRINAATILGQSKSWHQAEIDAACETIDFITFNIRFAQQLQQQQPISPVSASNSIDYRPLEGFVLAITPFNFTSIAANLPFAPALMGNVVVWKPSPRQAASAHVIVEIFAEAGLPPGVINVVYDEGPLTVSIALARREFAGLHFTGSTAVFSAIAANISANLSRYRETPRIVGETGGKNFVLAHPSADIDALAIDLIRGAFEYQGQKCSAASRAYVPASLWPRLRHALFDIASNIVPGNVADPATFMGAVISENAFVRLRDALAGALAAGAQLVCGGASDPTRGWFVAPTILQTTDPRSPTMTEELFGPILSVYVYDDGAFDTVLDLIDTTSIYALTGAIYARDEAAIARASARLRYAAGNLYINDKPTGAVVWQQPFGGGRASGTNDKAGSLLNLARWVSPRSIKRNFAVAIDWRYPHMLEAQS